MRVAISNSFAGQEVAETGLSIRIHQAARNLGWEAVEVASSAEINRFSPDFVIALHFFTPKLTGHATYGCMWNPPSFFEQEDRYIKNILSYDGYLSSSDHLNTWLRDLLYRTRKKHFIAPFYTSCHRIPYQPPDLTDPRLLYAGTNWDGPRYQELFRELDAEPYVDIYGGEAAWSYLKHSYRGLLPFDGSSILTALNRAGVGLCLHKEEHIRCATPSLRIFEIVASGAIAICQEHPFIREAFGDNVLYLDSTPDIDGTTRQISEYVDWITTNQEAALKMSRRAYDIFAESYSLEVLLSGIAPYHQKLSGAKGFLPNSAVQQPGAPRVQFIVRVGDKGIDALERTLDSIANQPDARVAAIIIKYREVPGLSQLLKKYENRFPVKTVGSPGSGFRSTSLWDGLKGVSAEYFAILDEGDLIYHNHVSLLVDLLDNLACYGVAYSGAIRISEAGNEVVSTNPGSQKHPEIATLAHFEPFDQNRLVALDNFIATNSFVARSALIQDIGDDPQLKMEEVLFLLLTLTLKTDFIFSYDVTCEVSHRHSERDEIVAEEGPHREQSLARIKRIFWRQGFPFKRTIEEANNPFPAQLTTAQKSSTDREVARLKTVITLMEESKFWKLRKIWFRIKRYINLAHG